MKVKNEVFINGKWDTLVEFGKKELPFKIGYDVSRIIRKMNDGFETFTEAKNKIIKKLGKEDKKTKQIKVDLKDDKIRTAFNKELKVLTDIEEEYDIRKLVIDSKEMKDQQIKPNTLVLLEEFIEVK